MDADFMPIVGWIVGIVAVFEFFHIGYLVSGIRRGMVALEQQAAEQTRYLAALSTNIAISTNYLAAISTNIARQAQESSQSNVDSPKS